MAHVWNVWVTTRYHSVWLASFGSPTNVMRFLWSDPLTDETPDSARIQVIRDGADVTWMMGDF